MQWTAGPQAGFSTNPHTWLPVGDDASTVNVATESSDPHSLLRWNESLLALRRSNPSVRHGGIVMLDNENPAVLSYLRTGVGRSKPVVVMLNMTDKPQTVHLDLRSAHVSGSALKTLLASAPALSKVTSLSDITLPPYASLVAAVE